MKNPEEDRMLSSPDMVRALFGCQRIGQTIFFFFCLPGKLCHRILIYTWENKVISNRSVRLWGVRDTWTQVISWIFMEPLWEGVCVFPSQDSLKISDDRLESKSVGKHLEIIISMKNTDHALISWFISIFQWNAPKATINKLNSQEKEAGLLSLT